MRLSSKFNSIPSQFPIPRCRLGKFRLPAPVLLNGVAVDQKRALDCPGSIDSQIWTETVKVEWVRQPLPCVTECSSQQDADALRGPICVALQNTLRQWRAPIRVGAVKGMSKTVPFSG